MSRIRRICFLAATLAAAVAVSPDYSSDWCEAIQSHFRPELSEQEAADRAAIEAHPICVGSRVWSAGTMADTVLYEYRRHGDYLTVGYFVHWTTERPWGKNNLTYGLLPALVVDAVYSHTLFLLPGMREALYGPGDVEGASVTYRQTPSGELVPVGGVADDTTHRPVRLSAEDLDAGGRTALVTEAWSHQLGGKGGASLLREVLTDGEAPTEERGGVRCFSGESLRPMSEPVMKKFRLGSVHEPRRAKPAWRFDAIHEQESLEAVAARSSSNEEPAN